MTTTPGNAPPTRRRSLRAGTALAFIISAIGLAACSPSAAPDKASSPTTQTTEPVVAKSAGAAGLNVFQFRVASEVEQPVPVRLCYAEINASSCFTVDVTKDKPTDAFIHGEIAGVVGTIPEPDVPSGTPVGASYHLFNPSISYPIFETTSAKYATADNLKRSEAPNKTAFPSDSGQVQEVSLADNDNYYDFDVEQYTLRINRKGDATAGGDKVVWMTIMKAPPIPATPSTTTTTAP